MRCHYCGVELLPTWRRDHPRMTTRDHVVPTSRGGKENAWVACCLACNRDKNNLTLAEWRIVLSWRYRTLAIFAFERARIRVIFTTWMHLIPAI